MRIDFIKAVFIFFVSCIIVFGFQTRAYAKQYECLDTMYRIVEAEATGEGFDGKQFVCEAIMNRVHSDSFPDSIEDVVFEKNQFSPIIDGRYWEVTITEETVNAVNSIMFHGIRAESRGVVFFQSSGWDGWINRNREFAFNHNNHNFYY